MQQESDFTPDHMETSRIGDHQPPQMQQPRRKGLHAGVLAVICLLFLGGGFIAGIQYQKGKTPVATQAMGAAGQYGQFGGGGMRQRAGGLGTVTAVSSSSITITERSFGPNASSDGTSKTYSISSSTKITDADGATATTGDIKTGDTVLVRTASSTSTAATEIRINPTMGAPGASGTSQSSDQSDTGSSASSI